MNPKPGETWIIEHRFNGNVRVGEYAVINGATQPGWLFIGGDGWLLADQWKPVRRIDLEEGRAA